jgi:hypothetical protein
VLYVLPGSGLQQIWSRARDTFLEGRALSGWMGIRERGRGKSK